MAENKKRKPKRLKWRTPEGAERRRQQNAERQRRHRERAKQEREEMISRIAELEAELARYRSDATSDGRS